MRTRDDVEALGRVIEADTGAPIVGARVYAQRSAGYILSSRSRAARIPPTRDPDAVSDADGRFRVATQSWVTTTALIGAEGKSPRMTSLRGTETTAASNDGPVVIELVRAARIEGSVRGAPRGAEVRAEVKGYELFDSSATVSLSVRLGVDAFVSTVITEAGTFALEDVPVGARAKLTVYDPAQKKSIFAEPGAVATASGVTHRVDWVIGGGGRFVALVREVDGSPAVNQEVWLLSQGHARPGLIESYWDPIARSRSDAAGLAVFADVAAGTWIVGLAPERRAPDERAFPAVAIAAEMGAAGGDVALEFTVQRGHYIAGQVLDAEGAPAAAHVTMWDISHTIFSSAQTGKDGTFRLGPLPLTAFELSAQVFGRDTAALAPSEAVRAEAGDVDVVLRLRPGCAIAVTTVDATTGAPAVARVSLSQHEEEYGIRMNGGEQSGAQFDGLLPATYTLLAKTLDGRAGLLPWIALEADERREVEIRVAPAGTVRVRYAGPSPYVNCRIEQNGVFLDVDTMQSGAESRFVLPPGRFTLEATIIDRTSTEVPRPTLFEDRRELEVIAGAELVIELALD